MSWNPFTWGITDAVTARADVFWIVYALLQLLDFHFLAQFHNCWGWGWC